MSGPDGPFPPILPATALAPPAGEDGPFVAACWQQPDAMLYFLLNVGERGHAAAGAPTGQ